jgi:hypothetical protein
MDNDHWHKITSSMVIVIVIVGVLPTTFVYAQTTISNTTAANTTSANTTGNATTTTAPIQLVTPSAAAQQIINNTQAECVQAQFSQRKCVILVYESPTTVVLNGRVKIFGGSAESPRIYPNPFLWNAVDGFKAQGYTITTIERNEISNKSSDNEFHVIMSSGIPLPSATTVTEEPPLMNTTTTTTTTNATTDDTNAIAATEEQGEEEQQQQTTPTIPAPLLE